MPTSGTFNFRLSAEEMVVEAYERCGVDAQMLTQYDAESARRSLNLMFTEWSVRGVNYWAVDEQIITTTTSQAKYPLPDGTVDVLTAVLRRSNVDTVMDRISLADYHELPDKTTTGRPTVFWFDRQYVPNVFLWQTPENSTDQFRFWRLAQVEDVDTARADVDIPYRWTEATCAGLAAKLSVKKAVDRVDMLTTQAENAFTLAKGDERERATLRIVPSSVI